MKIGCPRPKRQPIKFFQRCEYKGTSVFWLHAIGASLNAGNYFALASRLVVYLSSLLKLRFLMAKHIDAAFLFGSNGFCIMSPFPISHTNFQKVGGIYAFASRSGNDYTIYYIGKTNDLSTRFSGHHKIDIARRHGANLLLTMVEEDESKRTELEIDLIKKYKPICNDQHC